MESKVREKQILDETESFIKTLFAEDSSGHDWWHIFRVRNLALKISETEGGNPFIIELSALLHDLEDWKLPKKTSEPTAKTWLKQMGISQKESNLILEIIDQTSFKGAGVETEAQSMEAQIVQDADRLDAMGAIGIARTFAYGGSKGRLLYHPNIRPELHQSFETYQQTTAPTINHFYEKLLLLKDRLNTHTAFKMAEKRHSYMENFLKEFFNEWEGKN